MSEQPMLVISADGHVTAPMREYRSYIESRYHDDFDAFLEAYEAMRGGTRISPFPPFHDQPIVDNYVKVMIETGAVDGEFDAERRLEELERDGVVGEVLFPNGAPFLQGFGGGDTDLAAVGRAAYNRWLTDFVSESPERFCGQALVSMSDVAAAVADVRWAKDHGLRTVIFPGIDYSLPLPWDPIYDPFWSVLEELEMPLVCHGGSGMPNPLPPGAAVPPMRVLTTAIAQEHTFWTSRPLWLMTLSGVFERHPNLRMVWTEALCDWVPQALARMDGSWEKASANKGELLEFCPQRPSSYWERQCFLGNSLISRAEMAHRDELGGIDKMMFGVDFPHIETSWPHTTNTINAVFAGNDLSERDARKFLGLNAAEVFGFDVDKLTPIADKVGPLPSELFAPAPPDDSISFATHGADVLRPYGAL
jgi:predicted TIM-barrel fold metal-dependent hydrolase